MLNIQIDNPALEKSLKQTYGNDVESLARDFLRFAQQRLIQQDVQVSLRQLEEGQGIPLANVIQDIRRIYF